MHSENPSVSVLLPAYNGEATLDTAIRSILTQTLNDIQLVVVDDGSTDGTWDVISAVNDPRMVAVRHDVNQGLVGALTTGLGHCTGRLIARQDQDDISLPGRLEVQRAFLEGNPDVVLVGTWARVIPAQGTSVGRSGSRLHHPTRDEDIRLLMTWNNPFVHGSVMMRRDALDRAGGYSQDPSVTPPEDYELWTRMARQGKVSNISSELVLYRQSPGGMSVTMAGEIERKAHRVALRAVRDLTGTDSSDSDDRTLRILNGSADDATLRAAVSADTHLVKLSLEIRSATGHAPLRQLARGLRTIHAMHIRHTRRK